MVLQSITRGDFSLESRDSERPNFSVEQADGLVTSLYGLSGVLRELPSERDQNFHLVTESGGEFVLKIAAASEKRETLDMQNNAMHHLSKLHCPKVRKSVNGFDIETTVSIEGTSWLTLVTS